MSKIEDLFEVYCQQRELTISFDQFLLFAELFPAVLVIMSDGKIDNQERIYLDKLNTNLANIFEEDGLTKTQLLRLKDTFAKEFDYLIAHLEEWKEAYLNALQDHLNQNPETKDIILDTLHLFAAASEDINIDSEAENQMIEFLVSKLNLIVATGEDMNDE